MTCKVARKKKKHCDLLADFKWKIPKEFRVTARPLLVTDASPTDNAYILSPAWRAVSENRLPTRRTPSINTGQKTPSSSNSPRGAGRHRTARSGARGRAQVAVRGQTGQPRSAQGQPRAPGRPSAPRPLTARRPARRALPRGVAPSPPPPPGRPAAGTKPRPPAPHRTAPPRAPAAPETMVTGRSGAAARGNGTAATRGGEGRGSPAAAPVNLSPAARPRPPRLAPRPAPRPASPTSGRRWRLREPRAGLRAPPPPLPPRPGRSRHLPRQPRPPPRAGDARRALPCPALPGRRHRVPRRSPAGRAGRRGGAGRGGAGPGGEAPPTTGRAAGGGRSGAAGPRMPAGRPRATRAGVRERAVARCEVPLAAVRGHFLLVFGVLLTLPFIFPLPLPASPFLIPISLSYRRL